MKINKYILALNTLFLGAILASCNKPSEPVSTTASTNTATLSNQLVRIVNNIEELTLDPAQTRYSEQRNLLNTLFEPLMRYEDDFKLVPAGALSATASADGLVWTIKLRPEAQWHDGKPVVANDYVYAWQRLAMPQTYSPSAQYLTWMNLHNAQAVLKGELPATELGIKAIDDYTLELTLDAPTPWLADMLTKVELAPLRHDIIDKFPSGWTDPEHLIGNGAYKLTARDNTSFTLTKADTYWNKDKVQIEQLVVDTQVTKEEFGPKFTEGYYAQVPWFGDEQEIKKQEAAGNLRFNLPYETQYLVFGKNVSDVRVKQALTMLSDPKVLKTGYSVVAESIVPILSEGQQIKKYSWLEQNQDVRMQEARELLAQAGYTTEQPLELNVFLPNNIIANLYLYQLEQNAQGLLKFVRYYQEPFTEVKNTTTQAFDLVLTRVGSDYKQVSSFLNNFRCNSTTFNIDYCNAQYDALLDQALHSNDAEKRKALYSQAVDILYADAPVVAAYELVNATYAYPSLKGYSQKLFSQHYQDWYVEKSNK